MNVDPQYIQAGMDIVGRDGGFVGTVKEVRADVIVVDRRLARDLIVPLEAVQAIMNDTASSAVNAHVVLAVLADSVTEQGWEHPV